MPKETGALRAPRSTQPLEASAALETGLFKQEAGDALKGLQLASLPPMIKPEQFPDGVVLRATLEGVFEVPVTPKKKGKCLTLSKGDEKIAIPATATIAHALRLSDQEGNLACEFIGQEIAIKKETDKLKSKKGQPAWNFKVYLPAKKA